MRYPVLIAWLGTSLVAQAQPNCTGITLDFDARCSCIKDPNSQTCQLVKLGFYDGKMKPPSLGWATGPQPPTIGVPQTQTTRPTPPAKQAPRQARVVPLTHKDYLRFLQPNASLVAGFDLERLSEFPGLVETILGQSGGNASEQLAAGLKEIDHFWMSVAGPNDAVVLMTGKFEQGKLAGMFYAQGVYPVFLGSARAMLIGPEPALQAALSRLAKPASATDGWAARRARELARDHETWIATEPRPAANQMAAAQLIRRFALGFRLSGEGSIDGEAVADSESGAVKISSWVDQIKTTGAGALDALTVTRDGSTVRFAAKGDGWLAGDASKPALNSDFGAELYAAIMSGFPGMPARIVAQDKLLTVREGMRREDILTLLGPPLSVTTILGLDKPRETWVYQTQFGKQFTLRLDGGLATGPPALP